MLQSLKFLFSYWCLIFLFFFFRGREFLFFSEHFGWNEISISASQATDYEDSSDDAGDNGPADDTINLDQCVMQFVDDAALSDLNLNDKNGDDDNDDHDLFKIRAIKIRDCGFKTKCISIFNNDTLYSHILYMRRMAKVEKNPDS